MPLLVHILGGALAIAAGFVALYAGKGRIVHRAAGTVFVYTMLVMCLAGLVMAVVRDAAPAINIPAASLTIYLVLTALLTVRTPSPGARPLIGAAMLAGLAIGLVSLRLGLEALATAGTRDGLPAFPFLLFGTVGLLGATGDFTVLRSGPLRNAPRLARHLWRMCFALFIAVLSLFLGQADEFPQALRDSGLLPLPVAAVFLTMLYWLWRVRIQRNWGQTPISEPRQKMGSDPNFWQEAQK